MWSPLDTDDPRWTSTTWRAVPRISISTAREMELIDWAFTTTRGSFCIHGIHSYFLQWMAASFGPLVMQPNRLRARYDGVLGSCGYSVESEWLSGLLWAGRLSSDCRRGRRNGGCPANRTRCPVSMNGADMQAADVSSSPLCASSAMFVGATAWLPLLSRLSLRRSSTTRRYLP